MAPREWRETAGPPPWRLLSPSGVLHFIAGERELVQLGKEQEVRDFQSLVGVGTAPPNGKLPQHRGQWQLFEKVVWLQRIDDPRIIIHINGDAKYFIENFASLREDTRHINASCAQRFQSFLNGNLQSSSEKRDAYSRKGVPYKWVKMGAAPDDALERVPFKMHGPYSPLAQASKNSDGPFSAAAGSREVCSGAFHAYARRCT
jgi:hypothetical protein